jgi:hypothetical protein
MAPIRHLSGGLAGLMLGCALMAGSPAPAGASRSGERLWRTGTYLGTAGTVAALLSNKDTLALVGAGATYLSYTQWKREVKRRHSEERRARILASQRRTRSHVSHKQARKSPRSPSTRKVRVTRR